MIKTKELINYRNTGARLPRIRIGKNQKPILAIKFKTIYDKNNLKESSLNQPMWFNPDTGKEYIKKWDSCGHKSG